MAESLDYIKPLESLDEMIFQVDILKSRVDGMAAIAHEYQDVLVAAHLRAAAFRLIEAKYALTQAVYSYKEESRD